MIKLGDKLKEARIAKGLSLEDVSKTTKIKILFLENLEKGEYIKLPSVSYATGFTRNYIKFLGLPEKSMMALFRREFDQESVVRVLPKGFSNQNNNFAKRNIRFTTLPIIALFIIFIFYLIFQYRFAFLNPTLDIYSPKENEVITTSEVLISGKTDPDTAVYIDKNLISADQSGNFQKTFSVFPGIAIIEIKAINKFKRETDKKIQIDVKAGY
jgi:cytoskeletal protein RodZ